MHITLLFKKVQQKSSLHTRLDRFFFLVTLSFDLFVFGYM